MIKLKKLPLLLLLFGTALQAQSFSYPKLKPNAADLQDFIPQGWTLKDSTSGDLDHDALNDLAFVLEFKDTLSETRPDATILKGSHPRMLAAAVKTEKGYKLAIQDNTFILREGEGGMVADPYDKLKISRKGTLSVNFEFVRGYAQYRFHLLPEGLCITGATSSNALPESGVDKWDFNFLSGKVEHVWKKSNNGKKITKAETWNRYRLKKPKPIAALGMPFQWEIMKDIFL